METQVVVAACLHSAEKTSRADVPGGGALTDAVLSRQLVPAVSEALDAAAVVAPVFAAAALGSGGGGGRGNGFAKISSKNHAADGVGDVMTATASLLKSVVVAAAATPAAAASLSGVLHLALAGYSRDPVTNAPLLSVGLWHSSQRYFAVRTPSDDTMLFCGQNTK